MYIACLNNVVYFYIYTSYHSIPIYVYIFLYYIVVKLHIYKSFQIVFNNIKGKHFILISLIFTVYICTYKIIRYKMLKVCKYKISI